MKRTVAALALALLLIPAAALAGRPLLPPDRALPGSAQDWQRYDNLVFLYGFSLPGDFLPVSEQARRERLDASAGAPDGPGSEELYDYRAWLSADGGFLFEFQLKEPTYASFEEEVARYPEYLGLIGPGAREQGITGLRFAHDEVRVRQMPAGRMLENATLYEVADEQGTAVSCSDVYYDFYGPHCEYIFRLLGIAKSYSETSGLLESIVNTARVRQIVIRP